MSIKGDVIAIGLAGAVLLAAGWYAKKKITDTAGDALQAINPLNNDNVFNKGFSWAYSGLGAHNSTSIGADVYDLTHPPTTTEEVKNLPMGAGTAVGIYQWATGSKGDQVNDFKKWWASW